MRHNSARRLGAAGSGGLKRVTRSTLASGSREARAEVNRCTAYFGAWRGVLPYRPQELQEGARRSASRHPIKRPKWP